MRHQKEESAFALTITLVLMAFIVIVVVAYLATTRTARSTSSVYANRQRAQIAAENGLAAAIEVLRSNTRYGNYITAMPAPSPSPAPLYTEVYRPTDQTSHALIADDYLRLDNVGGEVLVSRATVSSSPGPDPRPTPDIVPSPIPSGSPLALPSPSPALIEEQLPATSSSTPSGNSYNFNQLVRIGSNNSARLVQPSPSPAPPSALGQWVNVRNSAGDLVSRYAFFVEDESMKLNVNVAGNNAGASGSNMRVNDLASPPPTTTPASQIEESDPGAVLPMVSPTPDRVTADTTITGLGASGGRLKTRSTLGLISEWNKKFPDYAHLVTVLSRDDNTTARGWQRMDLNAIAGGLTTNAAKVSAATRIANWIKTAWTGPTAISSLTGSQLYNDDRLRTQVAANIVDYIAPPGPPTDMSPPPSPTPSPAMSPVPVIGIEKIPYIQAVEVIYQAGSAGPTPLPTPWPTPGTYTTTIKVKVQFRFVNLFESNLVLTDQIGKITVTGIPKVTKNNGTLIDVSTRTFTINATDLTAYKPPSDFNVPAGKDGDSSSGARDFQTAWLETTNPSFTILPSESRTTNPKINSSTLYVTVLGKNNERLDTFGVAIAAQTTGYYHDNSGSSNASQGDFVKDSNNADGSARSPSPQIASINLTTHLAGPNATTAEFGDPRYRGPAGAATLGDRWDNDSSRSDATCGPSPAPAQCGWITPAPKVNRIDEFADQVEAYPRSYAVDWFDYSGDRPLAFIRNGPMLNIGELGNIATCEYPWRTIYLQHPERPANTSDTPSATDIPTRRQQSLDYVLVDLFRAGGAITRSGAININTQQQYLPLGGTTISSPLEALFVGVPVGVAISGITPTPQPLTQSAPQASPSPADRVVAGINTLVSCKTVPPPGSAYQGTSPKNYRVASVSNKRSAVSGEASTPDNDPTRPYFQPGELAATLSRLCSESEASDTTSSSSTSNVVYSALRPNPTTRTNPPQNYRKDFEVEQVFREVSNSITTRGNVFRILYVGQTIKDINHNGTVDTQSEVVSEYLGEAFVERKAIFKTDQSNSDIIRTSDSTYNVISNRVITE